LRLHSSDSQWVTKEPWTYAYEAEKVMTEFLRIRHRLLPYLYTMNARSAIEGMPLVRPMYWAYPEHREAYEVPNQYLYGSELIVAPITTPQDPKLKLAKMKGWLPPGRYVDIFTGALYDGDRGLWISRKLKDYPVFAKEGAIIPLDAAAEPGNGEMNPVGIEILIVVGADGAFELLEDDGSGSSAEEVNFVRTPIRYSQVDGTVTIGPSTGAASTDEGRGWTIRFLALSEPKQIKASVGTKEWDVKPQKVKNGIVVQVDKVLPNTKAAISLGSNPELSHNDVQGFVRPILADAQIQFKLKEDIWQIVSAQVSGTLKASRLHVLGMDENLRNAVLEYVLAE
jgi:hypothetical protein